MSFFIQPENAMRMIEPVIRLFRPYPDLRWLIAWIIGIALIFAWNSFFLNSPDLRLLATAFLQTLLISSTAVLIAVLSAWGWVNLTERKPSGRLAGFLQMLYDAFRSAPQIIGLLIGYSVLTLLIRSETIQQTGWIMLWMSSVLALVSAYEFIELFRERIAHFKQKDFYPALRVCGVSEWRIINRDILWYNGRALLLQKAIAVFGVVVFLQCSIDFIISVGLTADISSANFPSTLGSVLSRMSSKQDILAIGMAFAEPSTIPSLFTGHLLGITAAALIVWTLIGAFQTAHEFTRRRRL